MGRIIMGAYLYEDAVKQLQETGSINLMDLRALPYTDLKDLLDEIQAWTLYANGDMKKFKKISKKNREKHKKDLV